jgi:NADH:ubiquinone oxidoreductase subunit 3 (subunit A)
MWAEILTSIPFVFLVSIIVTLIFYGIGRSISAKGEKTPGKLASYACGEDFPAVKLQVNVERFFVYTIYFLIFDALAFLMVLSFASLVPSLIIYPVIFSIIVLLSVAIMLSKRGIG